MPLPGGPAAKFGNRYETRWTLSELFRLLDGTTDSIRIESPGLDKAEFVVGKGTRREFHQAKRSNPTGSWSLNALASDDLLQAIGEALTGNRDEFVFVSGSAAPTLLELSEAARSAASFEEFSKPFLAAKTRREPFEALLRDWGCDRETAVDILRRIQVRTMGDRDLEESIRWQSSALFLAKPSDVIGALLTIVENSVHRTVTREDLVRMLGERGYQLRRVPDAQAAHIAARKATDQYLEGERSRLIRGQLIPRTAIPALVSQLEDHTEGVITGKAGAGKTAGVVQLIELLRDREMPVLAFRIDRHLSARTTVDLGDRLDLQESPVSVLASAAERAGVPGVLLIDQLDALSTVSGGGSEAIDLVNSLLREARGIRRRARINTIVVCRSFDWNHDHRLRRLVQKGHAQVDVTEFDASEVESILRASGADPASFGSRQLQLLLLPQNLYLFLEAGASRSQSPTFDTVKELFDCYWNEKRRAVASRVDGGTDAWMSAIKILCDEMTSSQRLYVRRERLDDVPPAYLKQMVSEGVLAVVGDTYGFGHQSFFDYCFARRFVNRPESLTSLLVSSEQHLFRRAQVRQVLTYLRDGDHGMRERYVTELRDLLKDDRVRPHIKELAFGLLSEVTGPTADEWEIWDEWSRPALQAVADDTQNTNRLSELGWQRLRTSQSWFAFIDESGTVKAWMESDNDFLVNLALSYLTFHHSHSPERVAALIEPYLERGKHWESRVDSVMGWSLHHTSRSSFDLFLGKLKGGEYDKDPGAGGGWGTAWTVLHGLADNRPNWGSETLSCLFQRRLAIARAIGEDLQNHEFMGFDRRAEELIRKCAEGAPADFVTHMLPVVLEISEFAQIPGEPPKRDHVWKWLESRKYPTIELACLFALGEALETLASDDVGDLRDVIADLRGRDTYIANFLLLALFSGGSQQCADEAVSLLCREPWRFECGAAQNPNWYAMEAIRKIVPHCSQDSRGSIQERILRYVRPFEKTKTGFHQHGLGRFALLSAIPEELRSTPAKSHFAELRRKFGEPPGEPAEPEAVWLPSPINDKATQRMTDDQWMGAITKYRSEMSPQSLRGELTGGALELARSLEVRAKEEPVRFAHLCLRLPPDTHPHYFERTLAALAESEVSSELKLQLAERAFKESPEPCGKAIADLLGTINDRLPEPAVQMLHTLATESDDPAASIHHHGPVGASRNPSRDIEEAGLNSTRGRAALAIANLIRNDRANIDRFQPTLEQMIQDPNAGVRSMVAGALLAVNSHDSAQGMSYFQRMDPSDDLLLSTRYVQQFIFERLHDSFDMLRPFVLRMLRSSEPSVCRLGARIAGFAFLFREGASDFVDEALGGGEEHRLGIAEVASANIGDPRYQAWCAEKLSLFFNDGDPRVRAQAASCFRKLSDERLEQHAHLIECYCDSLAFRDDPSPLLEALNESRNRLPGITCVVCERYLNALAQEGNSIHDYYGWQAGLIAGLVFRTYQQHQDDAEWAGRLLSLIDRICLETTGNSKSEFEQFDR